MRGKSKSNPIKSPNAIMSEIMNAPVAFDVDIEKKVSHEFSVAVR